MKSILEIMFNLDKQEEIMKKIGMLVVVMMPAAFIAAAQAEVRAGGLPVVAGVSSDCSVIDAGPRAGGLPPPIECG